MAWDVFVSYSTGNRAEAQDLLEAVEHAGHACWMAPRDIVAGTSWADAIIEAIVFVPAAAEHMLDGFRRAGFS